MTQQPSVGGGGREFRAGVDVVALPIFLSSNETEMGEESVGSSTGVAQGGGMVCCVPVVRFFVSCVFLTWGNSGGWEFLAQSVLFGEGAGACCR